MITVQQVLAGTVNNEYLINVKGIDVAIDYEPSTHPNIEEETAVLLCDKFGTSYGKRFYGFGSLEAAVKYANKALKNF